MILIKLFRLIIKKKERAHINKSNLKVRELQPIPQNKNKNNHKRMIWNVIHPETGQPRINRLILETYNLPWLNEWLAWYQN